MLGAALLASLPALALDLGEGRLSLNGFGSWGWGATTNDNNYEDLAGPDGQFGSGEFGLAVTARLSDRAVVGAQLRVIGEGGGVELDWVFGEWRFSDLAHVRLGVVKHPFGLFGDVSHVGTLRPFFKLPSGVYGATELTGAGVEGFSLAGALPSETGWSLGYELYGGSLQLPIVDVLDKLTDPASLRPGGTLIGTSEETKYIVGGRGVLVTPLEGLEVRVSAYGSPVNPTRFVAGPSVQYIGERLSVRAEYFFVYEHGGVVHQQRTHTAYAEAAWFLTDRLQVGIRGEYYRLRIPRGSIPRGGPYGALLRHRELAATLNYWFEPGFVIKLSVHAIHGNRFAHPLAIDDVLLGGAMARNTVAVILGFQFSF
jgi:hypothetical protein